jgi:hypothetical protein
MMRFFARAPLDIGRFRAISVRQSACYHQKQQSAPRATKLIARRAPQRKRTKTDRRARKRT